jgi:hypothetical protein
LTGHSMWWAISRLIMWMCVVAVDINWVHRISLFSHFSNSFSLIDILHVMCFPLIERRALCICNHQMWKFQDESDPASGQATLHLNVSSPSVDLSLRQYWTRFVCRLQCSGVLWPNPRQLFCATLHLSHTLHCEFRFRVIECQEVLWSDIHGSREMKDMMYWRLWKQFAVGIHQQGIALWQSTIPLEERAARSLCMVWTNGFCH